jgi:hypothetical protein
MVSRNRHIMAYTIACMLLEWHVLQHDELFTSHVYFTLPACCLGIAFFLKKKGSCLCGAHVPSLLPSQVSIRLHIHAVQCIRV